MPRNPLTPPDYTGWDTVTPELGPANALMGGLLDRAPNTTYGSILPFARDNTTGALRLALPDMLRSLLQGGVDLADAPSTGTMTPDATGTLGMFAGTNLLARGAPGLLAAAGPAGGKLPLDAPALKVLRDMTPKGERPAVEAPLPGPTPEGPIPAAAAADSARSIPGLEDRISTRVPSSVDQKGLAYTHPNLVVGRDSSRAAGDAYEKNARLIAAEYPGLRIEPGSNAEEISQQFVDHAKNNILWLHDQVPPATAQRSRLWYDGARTIADRLSDQYDLPPRATAGVIAAQSPQMDWFQNVDVGRRVLAINANQMNTRITPEMNAWANRYIAAKEKAGPTPDSVALRDMFAGFQNKPFGDIEGDLPRAVWTRAYDEAHNPKSYPLVTPEGDFGDLVRLNSGVPEKMGWKTFDAIGKAQSVLRDPSLENISRSMGNYHKVRNFYNNIISPNAPQGYTTIDTHAINGSLLYPMGGSHRLVAQGLGNGGGAASHAGTGSMGTYGLHMDAYQQAAAERGILPREMQSITWEALRGLFSPAQKDNKSFISGMDNIWQRYKDGQISIDDARAAILAHSGGIDPPQWHVSGP